MVILHTTFNITKIPDKQAMNKAGIHYSDIFIRLSFSKQQQLLIWIMERNISFNSVVVTGSHQPQIWQKVFLVCAKNCTTLTIQNFTEEDHSYDELAYYINRAERLSNLTLISCLNLHDAQLMDVGGHIWRNLQKFISRKCCFRDHATNYLTQFSHNLQIFVYKSSRGNLSLKEDSMIKLLTSCALLKCVDVDLRNISDNTLTKVGIFMEEFMAFLTERNCCQISISSLTSTINSCTGLSKFKVSESESFPKYFRNNCLFSLVRNCALKTVWKLTASNTSIFNDKYHLMALIEDCPNISHYLCLKGFDFLDPEVLDRMSSCNRTLQSLSLKRCGHNYTAENLLFFVKCCPQIARVNIFDCPPEFLSVNDFTIINEVDIWLTKLNDSELAEQWTNFDGTPDVTSSSDRYFEEQDDDSDVECSYWKDLEEY
jgi:hypothetical protein